MTTKSEHRPWWRRLLKVSALTLMAAVLFIVGMLVTTVSILTPDRLTPIVCRLANGALVNARFEADTVELTLRRTMPYLHLDVVNMRILSTAAGRLPADTRKAIGTEADTVLSVRRISGGVNLAALPLNRLQLSDLVVDAPMVNLVVLNDSVTNFDILRPSEPKTQPDEPFDFKSLPEIRIRRLAIENARPLRYRDIMTGTDISANLQRVSITAEKKPMYALAFGGDVQSETLLRYLTMQRMSFGLDGTLAWSQQHPMCLGISDMSFSVGPVTGILSTDIDAESSLTLKTFDFSMGPVKLEDVLALIPDTLKKEYGIPVGLKTNATVRLAAKLSEPFRVASADIPHGTVRMQLPDSRLSWNKVNFENVAADITATVPDNNINNIEINISRLNLRGPATDISLSGKLTSITDDPEFDGRVEGKCDLSKLPPVIANQIPGGISGILDADASFRGRPSMFSLGNFHRLHIDGKISLTDFRWISADTVSTLYTDRARLSFGTNVRSKGTQGQTVDSLLNVVFDVDSINMLHSDLSLNARDISLELSALNRSSKAAVAANRQVIPMGGGLKIGAFNLIVPTDTAVVRIRDINGMVVVRPHNNDLHTPELIFDINMARFAAGDPSTRLLLRNTGSRITAYRQPQTRQAKRIMHLCDSIHRAHPHLSYDSVYEYAMREHQLHRRRLPRVHPDFRPDSTEVIVWDSSNGLKRLLTEWRFDGSLTSHRGTMFTRMFPIRNRLKNVNITFNNDTILMDGIEYKVGHSDFTLSGRVTNIRRALTSRSYRSPLRINLELSSDTIDINQLVGTAFSGAANFSTADLSDIDSESALDREIGEHVANAPDSMAPLLIPKNIDATLDVSAQNILYSDILLHNFSGRLLMYDGALNMHRLTASSDIGSVDLSALYIGRQADSLQFGFGLKVDDFKIHRFLTLMPAIDSLMPLLRDFSGSISANVAATSRVTPKMDLDIPTLDAAIKLSGDSLVLIDPDTFKSLSKWLMFKEKNKNVIKHMQVQMLVRDNIMQMFPFIFDIDRYHLGVQGHNDFDLNFDYHIAVLKSPIPFKFGINIKGNPDKYKIRLGGAKFDDKTPLDVAIVDTTRINLVRNLEEVFRRGVNSARFAALKVSNYKAAADIKLYEDTLTHADSLQFIREGLIPAPPEPAPAAETKAAKTKKKNKKRKDDKAVLLLPMLAVIQRKKRNDE